MGHPPVGTLVCQGTVTEHRPVPEAARRWVGAVLASPISVSVS